MDEARKEIRQRRALRVESVVRSDASMRAGGRKLLAADLLQRLLCVHCPCPGALCVDSGHCHE